MRGSRLVVTLVLVPVMWLAGLQVLYGLVPWACRHPTLPVRFLFGAVGLLLVAASAASLGMGWHALRSVRRGGVASPASVDRTHFMALVNLGSGALFMVVALAAMIPMLMLGPCD